MRILIFGAAGFIGSHLTRYVVSRGHEVVAFCRSGTVAGFAGQSVTWAFGLPLPVSEIEGADCAIHLAHDFNGAQGALQTLEQTVSNIARLRALGVGRQIVFSSYSAGRHATSLYGRTKFALESNLIDAVDIVIVRPGLVLGNGGIYGRIGNWAGRLPIIPLPGGGAGRVPVIEVDRLCREVLSVAESDVAAHECNLFERKTRSLRELVLDAAAERGRVPWIVSVPTSFVSLGLRVATVLRLPLPINADNLEGFMANQAARHVSTLQD